MGAGSAHLVTRPTRGKSLRRLMALDDTARRWRTPNTRCGRRTTNHYIERSASAMSEDTWKAIEFQDIPSREEFERLTLEMLRKGISNSDRMRDQVRRQRRLKLTKATGRWNDTPSDKFVNEHAWVLEDLVVRKIIRKVVEKEYMMV